MAQTDVKDLEVRAMSCGYIGCNLQRDIGVVGSIERSENFLDHNHSSSVSLGFAISTTSIGSSIMSILSSGVNVIFDLNH